MHTDWENHKEPILQKLLDIQKKMASAKMIFKGIFSKKAFSLESIYLSNEEAHCLQCILRMNRFSRSRFKTRASIFFYAIGTR